MEASGIMDEFTFISRSEPQSTRNVSPNGSLCSELFHLGQRILPGSTKKAWDNWDKE